MPTGKLVIVGPIPDGDHEYVYEGVPPEAFTVTEPLDPLKQETFTIVFIEMATGVG